MPHRIRTFRLVGYLAAALLLSLLYIEPAAAQTPIFEDSGQTLGAEFSTAVALGDIDGDGDLDAVVGNRDASNQLWLNDGNGFFTGSRQMPGQVSTTDVALGDMDGDGDLDLFVAATNGTDSSLWFNDGTGVLTQGQVLPPNHYTAVALADFNSDGMLDAYLTAGGSYDWSAPPSADELWLNDGAGRLVRSDTRLDEGASNSVAAGKINRDALVDVFVVHRSGDSGAPSGVWLNEGDGTLAQTAQALGNDAPANDVALADFDGDGHLDAFVANGSFGNYQPSIVWFGDGHGSFVAGAQQPANPNRATAEAVTVGDIDGDGLPDAFVVNDTANTDDVWLSNGDRTFTMVPIEADAFSTDAALGDLNGDGYLDAFVTNRDAQANRVLFNMASGRFAAPVDIALSSHATDMVLGDFNRDGYPDVFVLSNYAGASALYQNDGNGAFIAANGAASAQGNDAAAADFDGDGLLDLYIAGPVDQVFTNSRDGAFSRPPRESGLSSRLVALGDLNGDGPVDALLLGDFGSSVLLNSGSGDFTAAPAIADAPWVSDLWRASDLALGDLDGDGDLDAVLVFSQGIVSRVLWNDGAGNFIDSGQELHLSNASGVALGDLDADGDLDAFFANGFWGQQHAVFLNNGWGELTDSGQRLGTSNSYTVALGDVDGDGDLDALVGSLGANRLWRNDGTGRFSPVYDAAFGEENSTIATALTDLDLDGDLDGVGLNAMPLYFVPWPIEVRLTSWQNRSPAHQAIHLAVDAPGSLSAEQPYAVPVIDEAIDTPINVTLNGLTYPGSIRLEYSLGGGGLWAETNLTDTIVANGESALAWNKAESGFMGQSDNVVLRLVFDPLPPSAGVTATYRYTDAVGGPHQWAARTTQSVPFRARGLQVRVLDTAGRPVEGAIVFRKTPADSRGRPLADAPGTPYTTNSRGYLQGRGQLAPNDGIAALAPIDATYAFVRYATSGPPTRDGLRFHSVPQPEPGASGVQTLTVSSENTLVVFDLDISLEWDARNDGAFLNDLPAAIERASDILYDVTEGQVALGHVRVYQSKDLWPAANVVIYASNSIHPRATMGGIVLTPTVDFRGDQAIVDAYVPGQIRMGPFWDPFNQSQAELQQDWWRAFAHELAHYLLFLPDNYIGVEDGYLISTNCQGSFMTSAYDEALYGEFLIRAQWTDECLKTVAARLLTGRTDWETISTFLPITAPVMGAINPGPSILPLAITQVDVFNPADSLSGSLLPTASRYYDLRDENGNLAALRQADAYLYRTTSQTGGDRQVTEVIALGSTGSGRDRIKVRGAGPSDRVCVFDTQHDPPRIGCTTTTGRNPTVKVAPVPGWQPAILVSPLTTTTLSITVTQSISEGYLAAQVLPAYGDFGRATEAPAITLRRGEGKFANQWTGVITTSSPTFEGFVRVWQADVQQVPPREAITQYFLSAGWGPNDRGLGGTDQRTVGPNDRGLGGVDERVWGPNDRGLGGADQRTWGPNDRGLGGADQRTWGPNDRGLGGADQRTWGPNDRGLGGADQRTWGPNDRGLGGANVRAWGANQRTMEAPIAAGDGRVTVFNLEDFLGGSAELSIQSISNPPDLPAWFTPVGKAYRISGIEAITYTVAFHYLQRDVPEGYERILQLYYRQNPQDEWLPLDTRLDWDENMASARMPGDGTYALVATVQMPVLQPGWNLLAYPIPEAREVITAFASIEGAYTTIYQLDPADRGWRVFDVSVAQQPPAIAEMVNDLEQVQFGQSYVVFATQAITPYLAVPGAAVSLDLTALAGAGQDARLLDAIGGAQRELAIAPGVVYGLLTPPRAGLIDESMELVARFDDMRCGTGTLHAVDGGWLYAVKVDSNAQTAGCGAPGKQVALYLNGDLLSTIPWSNSQATRVDLDFTR